MKTVKIIILGLSVVSLLQSCSYNFMEELLGEETYKNQKNHYEVNREELSASVNDSTSLVILNNNI
jgi:hypothetical protein